MTLQPVKEKGDRVLTTDRLEPWTGHSLLLRTLRTTRLCGPTDVARIESGGRPRSRLRSLHCMTPGLLGCSHRKPISTIHHLNLVCFMTLDR